jgi:hypothetical protein
MRKFVLAAFAGTALTLTACSQGTDEAATEEVDASA